MRFPRTYDATTTREEFLRLLPEATDSATIHETEGRYRGAGWSVRLTRIAPLAIGMVRLERHRVEIEFDGFSAEEQDRFMRRFALYYQRGGG